MHFLRKLLLGVDQGEDSFKISFYCLAVLAVVHCSLDLYLGKQAHLMMSLLLWAAIGLLLWDQRRLFQERQNPDHVSSFLGYALLAALLVISVVRPSEKLIGFFPLVAFLGWFLLFIGRSQYRLYFKEFSILLAFGLPKLIPDSAFGMASLTAKFSAYVLWRLGYPVFLKGSYIAIPNGGVEVVPACSGISLITHMLSMAVIFLCVFPVRRSQRPLLAFIAIVLGFIMNSMRVAILALLSTPQSYSSFQYWHSANGASVFVFLTLMLYSLMYFWFFKPAHQKQS
jgi:cyanoexosortase A